MNLEPSALQRAVIGGTAKSNNGIQRVLTAAGAASASVHTRMMDEEELEPSCAIAIAV